MKSAAGGGGTTLQRYRSRLSLVWLCSVATCLTFTSAIATQVFHASRALTVVGLLHPAITQAVPVFSVTRGIPFFAHLHLFCCVDHSVVVALDLCPE